MPTPTAEPKTISHANQARERLNQLSATLAAMQQRGRAGSATEPPSTAADQHRREEEQRRHGHRDGPGHAR